MLRNKRLTALFLMIMLVSTLLAGCHNTKENETADRATEAATDASGIGLTTTEMATDGLSATERPLTEAPSIASTTDDVTTTESTTESTAETAKAASEDTETASEATEAMAEDTATATETTESATRGTEPTTEAAEHTTDETPASEATETATASTEITVESSEITTDTTAESQTTCPTIEIPTVATICPTIESTTEAPEVPTTEEEPEPETESPTVSAPTVSGSYSIDLAKEAFDIMNRYRTDAGLPELIWSDSLYESGKVRAREIKTNFSHTRPDGTSCFTAFESGWRGKGENIYYGTGHLGDNAETAMTSWYNSDGHRANMLSKSFNHAAVACYYENGAYYWVTLFGTK